MRDLVNVKASMVSLFPASLRGGFILAIANNCFVIAGGGAAERSRRSASVARNSNAGRSTDDDG